MPGIGTHQRQSKHQKKGGLAKCIPHYLTLQVDEESVRARGRSAEDPGDAMLDLAQMRETIPLVQSRQRPTNHTTINNGPVGSLNFNDD